jgi:hypothetical protein
MSEATLTATVPEQAPQPGAIVFADLGTDEPQLAIVSDLHGSGTARIATVFSPGSDEVMTRLISCSALTAAARELDTAEQELSRRLSLRLVAEVRDQAERMREQVGAAHRKIASMRAYAIDKHLDGTICRDGLNDFLEAHDLDLYQPRYIGRVSVSFDVEAYDADDEYEATQTMRNCVEVSSDDGEASITSGLDVVVSDVRPLAEG